MDVIQICEDRIEHEGADFLCQAVIELDGENEQLCLVAEIHGSTEESSLRVQIPFRLQVAAIDPTDPTFVAAGKFGACVAATIVAQGGNTMADAYARARKDNPNSSPWDCAKIAAKSLGQDAPSFLTIFRHAFVICGANASIGS